MKNIFSQNVFSDGRAIDASTPQPVTGLQGYSVRGTYRQPLQVDEMGNALNVLNGLPMVASGTRMMAKVSPVVPPGPCKMGCRADLGASGSVRIIKPLGFMDGSVRNRKPLGFMDGSVRPIQQQWMLNPHFMGPTGTPVRTLQGLGIVIHGRAQNFMGPTGLPVRMLPTPMGMSPDGIG